MSDYTIQLKNLTQQLPIQTFKTYNTSLEINTECKSSTLKSCEIYGNCDSVGNGTNSLVLDGVVTSIPEISKIGKYRDYINYTEKKLYRQIANSFFGLHQWAYDDSLKKTVTGTSITFDSPACERLIELVQNGYLTQAGTGTPSFENVRPITGVKNTNVNGMNCALPVELFNGTYNHITGNGNTTKSKVILNSSTGATVLATQTLTVSFSFLNVLVNGLVVNGNKILCDRINSIYNDISDTEHIRSSTVAYPNAVAIYINKSRFTGYSESWTDAQKLAALNTLLSSNPITIVYDVANQINITGTPSIIPTLSHNTITNDGNGSMSCTYLDTSSSLKCSTVLDDGYSNIIVTIPNSFSLTQNKNILTLEGKFARIASIPNFAIHYILKNPTTESVNFTFSKTLSNFNSSIISASVDYDFSFDLGLKDYPIFDESYRVPLNNKILQHFKYREIGFETAEMFTDRLNTRMAEIMPYYNQLYKSTLLEFEVFQTYNMTTENSMKKTGSNTGVTNSKLDDKSVNSDAPQTMTSLTELAEDVYASSANLTKSETDSTNTMTYNTTDAYTSHVFGTDSARTNSSILMEYRQSFINVDKQILDELNDLFMGVYRYVE
jgi:hypothetical protein